MRPEMEEKLHKVTDAAKAAGEAVSSAGDACIAIAVGQIAGVGVACLDKLFPNGEGQSADGSEDKKSGEQKAKSDKKGESKSEKKEGGSKGEHKAESKSEKKATDAKSEDPKSEKKNNEPKAEQKSEEPKAEKKADEPKVEKKSDAQKADADTDAESEKSAKAEKKDGEGEVDHAALSMKKAEKLAEVLSKGVSTPPDPTHPVEE